MYALANNKNLDYGNYTRRLELEYRLSYTQERRRDNVLKL